MPVTVPLRPANASRPQDRLLLTIIFLCGFILRSIVSWQSPKYDELYFIQHSIIGPWSDLLWGNYSPNNHILYAVIAKLLYEMTGSAAPQLARLPAELAGIWVAWLLAKPFWPSNRGTALLILATGVSYPWLLAFSCDARGYSLMLALVILATLYLPQAQSRFSWRYMLAVVAAMMTLPIAVAPVIGHGILTLTKGRPATLKWLLCASSAMFVSALLYLPQFTGISQYWGGLHDTGEGFPLLQLLPYTGWHLIVGCQPGTAAWGWLMLLLALAPLPLAWRLNMGRDIIISCAIAVILALIGALAIPGGGQIRYLIWLVPIVILSMAALARWLVPSHAPRWAYALAIPILLIWSALSLQVLRIPMQPIEDAVRAGYTRTRQDHRLLVGVGIASIEAALQFGQLDGVAYNLSQLQEAENVSNRKIRLIAFDPDRLAQYDHDLWQHIQSDYQIEQRLPGRIADCEILSHR